MSAQVTLAADTNYYIDDRKAFLNDSDLVVISIYASGIPENASFFQISDHFSMYGEIVDLKLKKDYIDHSLVAFVKYSMPKYATRALLDLDHVICRKLIKVKACQRWFQLEDSDSSINTQLNYADNNFPGVSSSLSTSNYVHLNDDILEEVCMKMLPRNQLNFAMVSERFRSIFLRCAKKLYQYVNMDFIVKMARRNAFNFIEIAGPAIKGLYGSLMDIDDDIFNLINYFCKNLESIDWSYVYKKDDPVIEFLKGRQNLITLKLEFSELLDRGVAFISRMTNLTSLKLTYVYMSGEYMKNLTSLKELSILGSMVLEEDHFIEMIECMPDLELLDIRLCGTLTVDSYQTIAQCLPKLEYFKFSCYSGRRYEAVALIPALKHLEILDPGNDQTQLFTALAHALNEQLESLILSFYDEDRENELMNCLHYICKLKALKTFDIMCPPKITNDFLIRISNLPNLEVIRLQNCKFECVDTILTLIRNCINLKKILLNGCTEIKRAFLYKAIDLLKELKRPEPLVVGFWGTRVKRTILEKLKYLNGIYELEANFDVSLPTHYGEFEIRAISEIRQDTSELLIDDLLLENSDDSSLSSESDGTEETEETEDAEDVEEADEAEEAAKAVSEVSTESVQYNDNNPTSTL